MKQVWIADDDQSIRWVLEKALARASVPCRGFASGDEVLAALESSAPSVLVTDIRMPGCGGLELLQRVKERCPALAVIVMTAYTDLDSTVAAFQKGAFEYLVKPFDIDAAVSLVRRALDESGLAHGDAARSGQSGAPVMMRSSSAAMQNVFRAIGRLAASSASVLITGESGTGKELIARALHEHGVRAKRPFIAVNAAAIPRDLLEAELFGHERGAFTGATQLRRGRFEAADGGTLFLDEIGDMSLDLQTRLLRVLAQGSFYRVGGSQSVNVDVRIVAATHQPLEALVADRLFREDLYHRLNVIRLRLPALRERKEDIPALAQLFLKNSASELGVPLRRLSAAAQRALAAFDYPGNIRQLENVCHWVTVMSAGQVVDVKDLPPEVLEPAAASAASLPIAHERAGQSANAQPAGGQSASARPIDARPAGAQSAGAQAGAQSGADWLSGLSAEVIARLAMHEPGLMASLLHEFEQTVLGAALRYSQGRRAQAAERLGIGRNTFTRKYIAPNVGTDRETPDG